MIQQRTTRAIESLRDAISGDGRQMVGIEGAIHQAGPSPAERDRALFLFHQARARLIEALEAIERELKA